MKDDLIDAAQRLVDVLVRENDALKRVDYAAAVALTPAKEAALEDLTKRPVPKTLPPLLAALGQRLSGLAAENQILLERAITVQARVVQIVARAYAPPPGDKRYGSRRGPAPSARVALALSTRV